MNWEMNGTDIYEEIYKLSYDKCRFAFRGNNRKRYSVFKAQWNKYWEDVYWRLVKNICENNGLDAVEEAAKDDSLHETFHRLRDQEGHQQSRSIRDIQIEYDREQTEFP